MNRSEETVRYSVSLVVPRELSKKKGYIGMLDNDMQSTERAKYDACNLKS